MASLQAVLDQVAHHMGDPVALIVALVLGGAALSGRFSVSATQFLLFAAWIVGLIAIRGQPGSVILLVGGLLGGVLILLANYFRPETIRAPVDDKLRELAGLVNSVLERAGSYNFNLPLPPDDLFIKQYEELKNSPHPIWIDKETKQLRREFLHHCSLIGTREEVRYSSLELRELRDQLHSYGRQLIGKLNGEKSPEPETQMGHDR
jgi:hypothetical protein